MLQHSQTNYLVHFCTEAQLVTGKVQANNVSAVVCYTGMAVWHMGYWKSIRSRHTVQAGSEHMGYT